MKKQGFTLIELLVVIVIIGLLLSVILPRAQRASVEARFSIVRQHATEIGSYTALWAQNQLDSKFQNSPNTIYQILSEPVQDEEARQSGFSSQPLVNLYTGHENFREQVGRLVPRGSQQVNPFNSESYFSPENNHLDNNGDTVAPSPKPGLLYFVFSPDDPDDQQSSGSFYFIFTTDTHSEDAEWHGNMGTSPEAARQGTFVIRTARVLD